MKQMWPIAVFLLVSMVLMVPINVDAGEHTILKLDTNYTWSGPGFFEGYLLVNTTDYVSINWNNGNVPATYSLAICVFSNQLAVNWSSNLTEYTSSIGCVGAVSGYNVEYYASISGFAAPLRTYWFTPSWTGLTYIKLWTNAGPLTFNFTIKSGNYYVDRSEFNTLGDRIDRMGKEISAMNETLVALNKTIGTLDLQSIKDGLAALQVQIDGLTTSVANNTNNLTLLQDAIASLQGQLDTLKDEVSKINATVNTNMNGTKTNFTAINQSLADLSNALNQLNATVQAINIPPNTQADVTKLQTENAKLKTDLATLQKKVDGIAPSVNKTIYNNNTVTKKVTEGMDTRMALGLVIGAIAGGAVIGGIAGLVASRKRKEEPPEGPQQPREIPVAKATPMEHPKDSSLEKSEEIPLPEPAPEKVDNLNDVLTKLKGPEKEKLQDKSASGEADTMPIVAQPSDRLAKTIRIGKSNYTESQIMSRLSSLPRGLPSEFFGIDPSELANILMAQKYISNDEGDIVFRYEKKWYFGDPSKISTYLQRAKLPGK